MTFVDQGQPVDHAADVWAPWRMRRDAATAEGGSTALKAMHTRHGADPEHRTCVDCANLVRKVGQTARPYLKCIAYGVTNGAATDWRAKWPACGAFSTRGAPT